MWSVGVITFMVLCGQAPFDGANDTERLSAVRRGVFHYPPTAKLSQSAMHFINHLLVKDPSKRMTARAALQHPFLRGTKASTGVVTPHWLPAVWN
mmetsp:Transcript_34180/g.87613  ORF Transcript_34180/g.87613 Transcript_34180/m.87613 type:complete len:95 (-) Transcript_34180:19-303(-)